MGAMAVDVLAVKVVFHSGVALVLRAPESCAQSRQQAIAVTFDSGC